MAFAGQSRKTCVSLLAWLGGAPLTSPSCRAFQRPIRIASLVVRSMLGAAACLPA